MTTNADTPPSASRTVISIHPTRNGCRIDNGACLGSVALASKPGYLIIGYGAGQLYSFWSFNRFDVARLVCAEMPGCVWGTGWGDHQRDPTNCYAVATLWSYKGELNEPPSGMTLDAWVTSTATMIQQGWPWWDPE